MRKNAYNYQHRQKPGISVTRSRHACSVRLSVSIRHISNKQGSSPVEFQTSRSSLHK